MAIFLYVNVSTVTIPSTDLSKIENSPVPFKRHLFIPNFKVSFLSSLPKFPSMKTFDPPSFVCLASKSQTEPAHLYKSITCTAPPTLANFYSRFKLIDCTFSGNNDIVTVTVNLVVNGKKVFVTNIISMGVKDLYKLKKPLSYSTAFATLAIIQLLNVKSIGLSIIIEKCVPVGANLGSTAAMATAVNVAINELFGSPLPKSELVPQIIDSQTRVSNYNYNVAATILCGFVIVEGNSLVYKLLKYPTKIHLYIVIFCLEFDVFRMEITKSLLEYLDYKMLGEEVTISSCVSSILASDPVGFGKAISYDGPMKVSVIPGCKSIKKVTMEAGAYGWSTATMGLTVVAITNCFAKDELIGEKMSKGCKK
ncbi:homoserine kinase-like [Cornus florida]|uniref:homoserine kinase-like n=1 Tax=Cornus florida TaxID=4283 RepID=UPI00289A5CCC|nr:homoserine kinase-like [Cornus florida]